MGDNMVAAAAAIAAGGHLSCRIAGDLAFFHSGAAR
jgi:hypothetical protein